MPNISRTLTSSDQLDRKTIKFTFITLCIEEGVPITTVQMMAAHAKIETTRGYAKLGLSVISKDVERVFGKKMCPKV